MMKTWIKNKLLPVAANRISTRCLIKLTNQPLIHVFYHTVSDDYLPHIHPLYHPKTIKEFQNDIDFILKRFNPVSIEDVLNDVNGEKKIVKPSVHFSFDDGLSEIYNIIAPLLFKSGIPATLFVNENFVDNKKLFFRHKAALIKNKLDHGIDAPTIKLITDILKPLLLSGNKLQQQLLQITYLQQNILDEIALLAEIDFSLFLREQKPYLQKTEINDLRSKGFTIGGHSIDHPRYELIDEDEQIRQTLDSCRYVQQVWEEPHRYFAFPFSDVNVKSSFYTKVFSTSIDLTFGISGIKTEYGGKHIHRIDMENSRIRDPKMIINKAYLTHWLKQMTWV